MGIVEILQSVSDFLTGLGTPVLLPIVIAVLGIILGQKVGRAITSGLTVGVGFVGLNLVIGLLIGALDPATKALIAATGIELQAIDVGWGVAAAIAFGTNVGALVIALAFGINLVMLIFGLTKTLNVDIWNFWHYAFTGSLVTLVSGSLLLGLIAAGIHTIVALLIADWTADEVQEFFNLPGISIPQGWAITSVPVIKLLNAIVDRIPGLRDIQWDQETIRQRLGLLGQPLLLGTVLGLLLGLVAYGLSGWLDALTLAVQMGAVMLLIPRIIAIFMEGLTPLSEAARSFMQRRFEGREFYVGLDSAILIGHPITIAAAILLIPITLFLAFILPGNRVLPFADLAATAFFVAMVPPLTKGNFFRSVLYGTIIMVMVVYISSSFAPLLTQIASNIGYEFPEGATMITGLSGGNWIAWVLTQIAKLFA